MHARRLLFVLPTLSLITLPATAVAGDAAWPTPTDWSACGTGSFTGSFPDVDADACTDGRYPSDAALDAAALCDDGIVAVCDGVAFPSLAAGAAHCPGGVLAICPGTHRIEDPVMVPNDGPKRIEGVTGDAADVILDGGGGTHVLHILRGSTVTIANLTIQGGHGFWLPGGLLAVGSNVDLQCDVFQHNHADYGAGAVGVLDTNVDIVDSTFIDNSSRYEAGAIGFYGQINPHDTLTIAGSSFIGNTTGHGGGGAILTQYADGVVETYIQDSRFIGNTAEGWGGVYRVLAEGSSFTMRDSLVAWNTAGQAGALNLYWHDMAALTWIEGSQFVDNASESSASTILAGGACSDTQLVNSAVWGSRNLGRHSALPAVQTWFGPFRSFNTDWGIGSRENEGADYLGPCGSFDDLGPHETFTCLEDGTME